MSLSSFITGGISGILLGLITLFIVGPITFAFERLCGGNGKAAVACSTIAGTAMTTPVALAEVGAALCRACAHRVCADRHCRHHHGNHGPDSDRLGR